MRNKQNWLTLLRFIASFSALVLLFHFILSISFFMYQRLWSSSSKDTERQTGHNILRSSGHSSFSSDHLQHWQFYGIGFQVSCQLIKTIYIKTTKA